MNIAIDSQARLLAGVWIASGVFTFVAIRKFEENTNVLRLILLGMSLGSVGELITKIVLDGDVKAAVIKASIQVGIYVALELWRGSLVRKQQVKTVSVVSTP